MVEVEVLDGSAQTARMEAPAVEAHTAHTLWPLHWPQNLVPRSGIPRGRRIQDRCFLSIAAVMLRKMWPQEVPGTREELLKRAVAQVTQTLNYPTHCFQRARLLQLG